MDRDIAKPGRRRTACRNCSSLKVRCSGEKPSCARCSRLRRKCTWTTVSARQPESSSSESSSLQQQGHVRPNIPKEITAAHIPCNARNILVELYFLHMWSASLLLHRPSFSEEIASGQAKEHVVLSVCALASRFYEPTDPNEPVLDAGTARIWAERAGKLVLAEFDQPTEDNIVTCLNLTWFWFSVGHWERTLVYEAISASTSRLLGLVGGPHLLETSLSAELSRRRCWATFIINQYVTQGASASLNLSQFRNLPLPCEENASLSRQIPTTFSTVESSNQGGSSFFNKIIKGSDLWTASSALARDSQLDLGKKIRGIQKLDNRIQTWWKDVPQSFSLDDCHIPATSINDISQRVIIHILYYQSLCVLHASIVPLFSLGSITGEHVYAQSVSAQIALVNARRISEIFHRFGTTFVSYLPCYAGYAAYCSSAVQIPMLWCRRSLVRERALANIDINSKVLDASGKYWKFSADLRNYIPLISKYHESMNHNMIDEPGILDITCLNRLRGDPIRARSSILGFNGIIWSKGKIRNQDEEDRLDLDESIFVSVSELHNGLPGGTAQDTSLNWLASFPENISTFNEWDLPEGLAWDDLGSFLDEEPL